MYIRQEGGHTVRIKAALGLSLLLALTACSGGGLLPSPTPRTTPTPRPTAVRAPRATLGPAPQATPSPSATAAPPSGPEGAPEIVAGLIPPPDRDRYVNAANALRARDAVAGDWLLQSGLLLRDGKLDSDEFQALDVVLGHTKDDPLWYLTHVRLLDGISPQDVAYLKDNDAVPGANWFFDDDISGLQGYQLLSRDGQRSLSRIFDHARSDAEVRKGLYLINTLGMPDGRAFKYHVPAYNDQLYLLARLLEQGVPSEYERAAVAAALTYGSLLTLSDPSAREDIVNYASDRLRLLIDTDVTLSAAGAHWRAVDYPLEALLVLLWGGQAAAYPQPGTLPAQAPSLATAAAAKPLSREDVARLLVPVPALRQMQDEMLRAVVEQTGDELLAADRVEQWWSARRRDEADDGGPDLNRQWARFREGRGFAGGAEAAYVLSGLAASINLPLPWAQLWVANGSRVQVVPFGLRLDPTGRMLRLDSSGQRATAGLPGDAKAALVAWRVPWDNWHLPDGVRSVLTVPLPLSVWRAGIPSGYLLRAGVVSEGDLATALGSGQPG